MNQEVEIKVIAKNQKKAEEIIKKKAKFVKEREQIDEYFVPDNNDFFKEKNTKEYLRVRNETGKNKICYHYCHFDKNGFLLKTDEYESNVEDPKMVSEILKKLKMTNKVTVKKHRKYYEYKDFEILIDNIKGLGTFIEVEARVVEDLEKTRKSCYDILDELGIEWKKAPEMGYPDMLLEKE